MYEVIQGEEHHVGEALIKKRFVDSLLSGLRKPTIRLEMQAGLKQDLSDPKLFKEVNLITARDDENEKKLGNNSGVKANVKSIEVDECAKKRGRSKDDEWCDDTSAKIAALTAQVQKLEGLITQVATGNGKTSVKASEDGLMEQKMMLLLGQVQHLTEQMQEYRDAASRFSGGQGGQGNFSKKVSFNFKCDNCKKENMYCNHCCKCGE